MTTSEIRRLYGIPETALKIYEEQVREIFSNKITEENEYSDQELEKISMVMTLQRFGFDDQEIGAFFGLAKKGQRTKQARLQMLQRRRNHILEEIHQKEKILDELDYIRYELK